MSRNLIATVGSNPLPVVIVARHLKPTKLWLLFTQSSNDVRGRIERLLKNSDPHLEIIPKEMGEGLSLCEATEQLKADKPIQWSGANLNYTAGTKQMSVVVHELWKEENKESDSSVDACYLGADSVLYWDSGQKDKPEILLNLKEIARLHFDQESESSDAHKVDHLQSLSNKIQKVVSTSGIEDYLTTLPPVYGKKGTMRVDNVEISYVDYNAASNKNFKNDSPWTIGQWTLPSELGFVTPTNWDDVTRFVFPEKKVNKDSRLDTFKFLAAEWLETWLAKFLEQSGLFREVAQSFKIGSGAKEFELDAVALKGTRIYTFSCTIDQSIGLVKHKALEAHHRTQRIGGDHAAFAVFSLSKDPQRVAETIKEERWHGHDRARIFGIEHLRDTDKFRSELEEWLRH